MPRAHVWVFVVSLFTFVLGGCEPLEELLRELAEQQEHHHNPPPPPPPAAPSIESPSAPVPLGNGLYAELGRGLLITDLSDPAAPRVVSELELPLYYVRFLHIVGDRALVIIGHATGYRGARDDIPVPREEGPVVYNIDIHDRAHPVVLDRISLRGQDLSDTRLRRSDSSAELHVLTYPIDAYEGTFTIETLQLRDGRLQPLDVHTFHGKNVRIATASASWLVLSSQDQNNETNLDSLRLDVVPPAAAATIHIPVYIWTIDMALAGDTLRVPHPLAPSGFVIDSFVLTSMAGAAPSGSCVLIAPDADPTLGVGLFMLPTSDFALASLSSINHGQLHRYRLDPPGNCAEMPVIDASFWQMRQLPNGNLVGLEYTEDPPSSFLSLYDGESAATEPLARIPVSTYIGGLLQAVELGTGDEGLLATQCSNRVDGETWTQDCTQLVSYTDDTLTLRANLQGGFFGTALRLPTSELALYTSQGLTTFDARNLDAPRALGHLPALGNYRAMFELGEYVARIRARDWVEPDGSDWLEILPRTAAGERDPVLARIEVSNRGKWLQLDGMLASVRREGEIEQPQHYKISIVDVTNPLQPRAAGKIESDQIIATWDNRTGAYGMPRALGRALVWTHEEKAGIAFDVVDARDPDAPVLLRPAALSSDSDPDRNVVRTFDLGTKLYVSFRQNYPDEWDPDFEPSRLRAIDFADPTNPLRGPRIQTSFVPELVTDSSLYALLATGGPEPIELTRYVVNGTEAELQASHAWEGSGDFPNVASDGVGHLFVRHLQQAPVLGDPAPIWSNFAVLDDQSLALLADIPLDFSAANPVYAKSRVVLDGAGVLLLVDVRDPAAPRLQAAFPSYGTSFFDGDRIFTYGDFGVQVYDAATENIR